MKLAENIVLALKLYVIRSNHESALKGVPMIAFYSAATLEYHPSGSRHFIVPSHIIHTQYHPFLVLFVNALIKSSLTAKPRVFILIGRHITESAPSGEKNGN